MQNKGQTGLIVFFLILVFIILVILVVALIASPSFTGRVVSVTFEDSGMISQTYNAGDFTKIRIEGKANLFLTQDPKTSVKIEAEENVMKLIELRQEGETLIIGNKELLFLIRKPINIYISTPNINEVSIAGTGSLQGQNKINGDSLSIIISGFADVNLDLDVNSLETRISGSGDLNYGGKAENHKISISGEGDVRSFELETYNTEVSIAGAGTAEVSASQNLDIKIAGSGSIVYMGDPSLSQSISGSGNIKKLV